MTAPIPTGEARYLWVKECRHRIYVCPDLGDRTVRCRTCRRLYKLTWRLSGYFPGHYVPTIAPIEPPPAVGDSRGVRQERGGSSAPADQLFATKGT